VRRKALLAGPAAAIDVTLETLKQDDGLEACVSMAWSRPARFAASPRRFVRLIGLNSSRWPRGIAEDRLIPEKEVTERWIRGHPRIKAANGAFRTSPTSASGSSGRFEG
jgi:hypothetical protein